MNNYYEILEVSKNASNEVIEKAYKVLTKKNHPDLQQENQKKNAEQKMKLLNEAYEILTDSEKRKKYDIELEAELEKINEIQYERKYAESLKNTLNNAQNNIVNKANCNYKKQQNMQTQQDTKKQIKEQKRQEKIIIKEYEEEQNRIYRNYMRSLGYRVKEKWTLKRMIKLIEVIGILVVTILIIWFLPPTHKLLIEAYEQNNIIKIIVDVIINIISGLGKGIDSFFKSLIK